MSKPQTSSLAAFPPDFPIDTDYVLAALAEWNRSRRSYLAFGELTSAQMREVLRRADWLKQAKAAQP